jgi:hypothetical protein
LKLHEKFMEQKDQTVAPMAGGCWTWWSWVLWLPGCFGFAVLLAWASVLVSPYFSPLLVFPLLLGFVLGASIVSLMRLCQMGHRLTAWAAVLLLVAVVVVGQHYLSYRGARAEGERQSHQFQKAEQAFGELVRGRVPSPPASLAEYLSRQAEQGRTVETAFGSFTAKGPMCWLSWAIDALLIMLPVATMVFIALRRPFCRQCGSWYSARRGGGLDADTVKRLAEELDLRIDEPGEAPHYRLLCCNQGCAPTGFALSCEKRAAAKIPAVIWLDHDRRNRVVEILDRSHQRTTNH